MDEDDLVSVAHFLSGFFDVLDCDTQERATPAQLEHAVNEWREAKANGDLDI